MKVEEFYELLWDFARQRVVTVSSRCGLLKKLAEGARSPGDLAGELGLDELATGKMVRALCALGVVQALAGERYRLHADLAPHFRPGEGDLTPFVEHAHGLYERWGANLEDWLRTGRHRRGRRTDDQLERFGRGMRASAGLMAGQVLAAQDNFRGVRRVLDLGGGIGGYAMVFCRQKEDLLVTVVDVPEVAEIGRRSLSGTGLEERIGFVGGDYHQIDLGGGYDLVLMANVLHIEKPERAAELVRRAAGALVPGGRLCVVDFVIDDHKQSNVMGALFAINMRDFGDTHSEPQIRSWMQAAGVEDIRRFDLPPAHWLIAGRLIST